MKQMKQVIATLALLVLAATFGAGRWSKHCPAPVRIAETAKEDTSKTWAASNASTASTEKTSNGQKTSHSTTEWYRPDGTLAKKLTLGEVALSQSQEHAAASSSASATGSEAAHRETTRVVELAKDRDWTLTLTATQDARAALRRDFSPVLGLYLTRRLLGALGAAVYVTAPTRDLHQVQAGAGLSLTFRF